MCGRLNVKEDPLNMLVSQALGIDFRTDSNPDLCPGQSLDVVALEHGRALQRSGTWGTKPGWAKRLIINAQAETVAEKPTFKHGFRNGRCIVPCSSWYEWCKTEGSTKKTRIAFHPKAKTVTYLAGIRLAKQSVSDSGEENIVILTTAPSKQYRHYHHRMPVILPEEALYDWLSAPPESLAPLLRPNANMFIDASFAA